MPEKIQSKEVGLELGLLIGRFIINLDDLHYGYWTDDLPVELLNMPKAQQQYTDFLISHIPDGVQSILDVGCGVGNIAAQLTAKGYSVDCVSPSPLLTKHAKERLSDANTIFECYFEKIETQKRYDLVLFSESFQYMKEEQALDNVARLLNPNGHLLICDFFRTDAPGDSPIRGGKNMREFEEKIARFPFKNLTDIDITKETAPTLDLVNSFMLEVGKPSWDLLFRYLSGRYPFIMRFVPFFFKKRLAKINHKYFSGRRTGETFSIFKTYRLLLYQKTG